MDWGGGEIPAAGLKEQSQDSMKILFSGPLCPREAAAPAKTRRREDLRGAAHLMCGGAVRFRWSPEGRDDCGGKPVSGRKKRQRPGPRWTWLPYEVVLSLS